MSWPVKSSVPITPIKFADMETRPLPKETYPIGSVIKAFVTNVHNVPALRFFVIAENDENARLFEEIQCNTQSSNAYKCMRMPPEGTIFGMRYGDSNVLRAVRLPTVCFTTQTEIVLPDMGRKDLINENDVLLKMYHLPIGLRKPPSMAICCQLRGINDNFTIMPDIMKNVLPGLLGKSIKFRIDGYIGAILKVQLMDIDLDTLKTWRSQLDTKDDDDLFYALNENVKFWRERLNDNKENVKPLNVNDTEQENLNFQTETCNLTAKKLLPMLFECETPNKSKNECDNATSDSSSVSSYGLTEIFQEKSNDDSELLDLTYHIPAGESSSKTDIVDFNTKLDDLFIDFVNMMELDKNSIGSLLPIITPIKPIPDYIFNAPMCSTLDLSAMERYGLFESTSFENMRPILGFKYENNFNMQPRPIYGASHKYNNNYDRAFWNGWKHDPQSAIFIVDKRSTRYQCEQFSSLIITPTYVGQLERFFGVIHEPNKCYIQHMWTDDEIDWSIRYTHGNRPLLFEVVLAKHCSDYNWYRAKVVEVLQTNDLVRVFFVDFGGECYVKLKNLARLDPVIVEMPFQAILFRLHALYDTTTSMNEHAFGVHLLRNLILKKTLHVCVIKCEKDELVIRFADENCFHVPNLLVRKGLMALN